MTTRHSEVLVRFRAPLQHLTKAQCDVPWSNPLFAWCAANAPVSAQRQSAHLYRLRAVWDGVEETLTWSQLLGERSTSPHSQGTWVDRRSGKLFWPQPRLSIGFVPRCRPELSRFRFRLRVVPTTGTPFPCSPIPLAILTTGRRQCRQYVQPSPAKRTGGDRSRSAGSMLGRAPVSRSAAHIQGLVALQYTSGSTHTPAGVMVSRIRIFS